MIRFEWLWALALLPLPLLVRFLMPPAKPLRAGALRVPFFREVSQAGVSAGRAFGRRAWTLGVLTLIWLLIVAAATRPTYVGRAVPIPVDGRDMVLAVDLSASMAREDLSRDGQPVDRLSVVKAVADDFIARREGDRIGLILFSTNAYIQAPLTFDRKVVRELLDEATIGLTGRETAIGDAIALAIRVLQSRPIDHRVLVLLTDGMNNSGVLEPLQAAQLAREEHVKIYTVGVGADSQAVGQQIINPSLDLDEVSLAKIAEMTGGRYFRARDESGLAAIYQDINRIEPAAGEPLYLSPTVSLFQWPLGAALVLSLLMGAMRLMPTGFRRREAAADAAAMPGHGAPS